MAEQILCAYGVDVDAVGGWLGSYGGEDSACGILVACPQVRAAPTQSA